MISSSDILPDRSIPLPPNPSSATREQLVNVSKRDSDKDGSTQITLNWNGTDVLKFALVNTMPNDTIRTAHGVSYSIDNLNDSLSNMTSEKALDFVADQFEDTSSMIEKILSNDQGPVGPVEHNSSPQTVEKRTEDNDTEIIPSTTNNNTPSRTLRQRPCATCPNVIQLFTTVHWAPFASFGLIWIPPQIPKAVLSPSLADNYFGFFILTPAMLLLGVRSLVLTLLPALYFWARNNVNREQDTLTYVSLLILNSYIAQHAAEAGQVPRDVWNKSPVKSNSSRLITEQQALQQQESARGYKPDTWMAKWYTRPASSTVAARGQASLIEMSNV